MITINMDKAREIHKKRMRVVREPLFAELDLAFQRALETNTGVAEITAKKQALRDVTNHPDIAKAKTPAELKAVWPDVLKG